MPIVVKVKNIRTLDMKAAILDLCKFDRQLDGAKVAYVKCGPKTVVWIY